ncbi:hypothetical protein AB0E69_03760 [Kribbella sp. NPDC026611]|uniref:hypothetical protein n=1 Tax=Kribbella sp. NPDC026611 TaxID=3154911 RepID=UPI0033FBD28F
MDRRLQSEDPGYQLVRDIVHAVAYRLRVETGWNGVVYQAAAPSRFQRAGRAWNGENDPLHDWDTVTVNDDHSLTVRADILGHVLDAQAGRLDWDENRKGYQAMTRLVHGAVEASRHDPKYDPSEVYAEDEASDTLTLGLCQDWAWDRQGGDRNTQAIISRLGINQHTPRLTSSRLVDAVPHARTAAHQFVTELAKAARRPRDVTHRELVGTHPAERWNQIGDWLIDANLQGAIGPGERAQLRQELAVIAHNNYAAVAEIPDELRTMARGTPPQRVQFAHTLRERGKEVGGNALLRLNIHAKGTMVNWLKRREELDRVHRAAADLGIPVDQLQALMHATTRKDGSRQDGTPQVRPHAPKGYDGRH